VLVVETLDFGSSRDLCFFEASRRYLLKEAPCC
jgi:hypothetical protein